MGAPLGDHGFAQGVVGARLIALALVEIEAGPRLDDGVDIERADLSAKAHEVERRGVDREIDAERLAGTALQIEAEQLPIIFARHRLMLELDATLVEQP